MMDKKITIVGSYNVGIFLKSDNFPEPGETVLAHTYFEGGGGKGSNQAIATKVLGADTAFIGKIGLAIFVKIARGFPKMEGVTKE